MQVGLKLVGIGMGFITLLYIVVYLGNVLISITPQMGKFNVEIAISSSMRDYSPTSIRP